MAPINPIQGPIRPIATPRTGGPAGPGAADPKGGFGNALQNAINHVDAAQQGSAAAVQDLLTGKSQDILPVVAAVARADMSFKLLIGVRNKVIEAYKQTMNMPL